MKQRNQRIKTDYCQNSNYKPQDFTSKIRDDRLRIQKRVSSLGNRQVFISRIIQSLNHDQGYQTFNQLQLLKERESLKAKVKEMKEALDCLLERQSQKKNQEERVVNKAIICKQMGLDLDSINKECNDNRKTILALEQQFNANNQKLIGLCDPNHKLGRSKDISQAQVRLKEMKKLLSRMKKNKFLRERQIIKGKRKQVSQLQLLQQEYIAIAKKQQFLLERMNIIQQEMADIDYNLSQQKQYYSQVKQQLQNFAYVESLMEGKHLQDVYTTKKRKLQLNWKRFKREDESYKKKYYQLLLNYQNGKKTIAEINNKIFIAAKDNQRLLSNIETKFKKYTNYNSNNRARQVQIKTQFSQPSQLDLTAISKKENIIQQSVIPQSNDSRLNFQHKFNQINISHRKIVRKWNSLENRDSIIQQNPNSGKQQQIKHKQTKQRDAASLKFSQYTSVPFSRQIVNLRSKNTSKLDSESIASSEITFIQEQYCQQFDSL